MRDLKKIHKLSNTFRFKQFMEERKKKVFSNNETHENYVTFMEKLLYMNLQNATKNQYFVVRLKNGEIQSVVPHSRVIGFLTLGISKFFTLPYVIVEGERNAKNEAYIERMKKGLSSEIVNSLSFGE